MVAMLISSCSKRPPLFICALVALCLCFLAASCVGHEQETFTPQQLEQLGLTPRPFGIPPEAVSDEYKKANPEWKEQTERAVAVAEKYGDLFYRQPGVTVILVQRTLDEDGWHHSGPVGIIIYVDCTTWGDREEPQYSMPGWEPIPRQIEGVPIQLWMQLPGAGVKPCPTPTPGN